MNLRLVVSVSVALNVLLAGAAVLLWLRRPPPPEPQVLKETVTNVVVRGVVRPGLLNTNLSGLLSNVWKAVESPDYRTYIANLRAIGCPEETIRDIIITDINKLYAQKQRALNPWFKTNRFWVAGAATVDPAEAREFQKLVRQLEREKRELVRSLLGVDYNVEMARQNAYGDWQDRRLAFLPEQKRLQIRQIQEKFNDLREELALQSASLSAADLQAQLAALQSQQEAEIRALLSEQERREYDLRESSLGRDLQTRMGVFTEASEENFRKIFDIEQRFTQQIQALKAAGSLTPEVEKNLEQQRQVELKNALGDHYQEYERTRDPAYREIYQTVQQLKLPPQTAHTVHDLRRAAEEQHRLLTSNPALTPEQMEAGAAALRAEVERTMREVMGEQAYQEYLKRAGYWVNRLGVVPATSTPAAQPPPTVPQ